MIAGLHRLLGRRRLGELFQMRPYLFEPARVVDRVFHTERLRFLGDVRVSIARVRVIAQPLWSAGTALLFNRLEHVRHVTRVVPGARHDVGPFDVGLTLVLAAEPQECGAETELRALRDHLAPAAADDGAENRASHLTN